MLRDEDRSDVGPPLTEEEFKKALTVFRNEVDDGETEESDAAGLFEGDITAGLIGSCTSVFFFHFETAFLTIFKVFNVPKETRLENTKSHKTLNTYINSVSEVIYLYQEVELP